jgi:chromosome segregation ATPase
MTTSSELSRLTQELQSLKSNLSQQFKESQEKFRIQSDLQKSELSNLKDSAKHLVEENQLLQEHLKNSDNKIIRLEKENEELMRSLEQDSEFDKPGDNQDDFQFQVASLNEKIKNLHALLKAEKLKTLDALREKSDIAEIAEMTQKTTENKISIILSEIFQEKAKRNELKEQLESRSKVVQSADLENLAALNDHLNVKQRTIENLIHEKETLIELLQFEVVFN